jgi:hypothetical protein
VSAATTTRRGLVLEVAFGLVAGTGAIWATLDWPFGRSLAAVAVAGALGCLVGLMAEAACVLAARRVRRGWVLKPAQPEPRTVRVLAAARPSRAQMDDPERFWHEWATWR